MAKVMISMPDELLETLDEAAADAEMSRSAFIRNAIRARLVDLVREDRDAAIKEMREALKDVRLNVSPEELIRAERDR